MKNNVELVRVTDAIADTVIEFRMARPNGQFRMKELTAYVIERHPNVAPDSPGRILRDLRTRGTISYLLLNRRQSLYLFT